MHLNARYLEARAALIHEWEPVAHEQASNSASRSSLYHMQLSNALAATMSAATVARRPNVSD
jgi:hypothetical protein